MKKIIAVLLIMSTLLLFGCANNTPSEKIRVASLKGATSMGLVYLMEENSDKYDFTVAGSADEISPKFIQGDFDIACVPANLASVLYNRTNGKVELLAINTLGMLYVMSKNEDIKSVSDLRGKTVYATGKGSTPEYCLRFVLEGNGIDPEKDITINWMSEPTELVNTVKAMDSFVCMLPQPYVTIAKSSVEGLETKLSLNDEWNKIPNAGLFVTSVIAVRKEYAEGHEKEIAEFLENAAKSAEKTVQDTAKSAELIEKHGIFKKAVAEKAIPYCNIVFIRGSQAKNAIDKFFDVLYKMNPASLGGKKPESDFFYDK